MAELAKIEDPIKRILLFDMIDGDVVNRHCVVCKSMFRKEAESMFDQGHPASDIEQFLKGNGEAVSLAGVQYHMKDHYRNMERTAALLDYCDRLEHLREKRRNRERDLELMVDMCLLDLAKVASMPTNGDIAKEKVKTELAVKVRQDMRAHIQLLNEMQQKSEAIKAVEMKFLNAWKTCIDTAENPEQKQLYASALREFEKTMREQE